MVGYPIGMGSPAPHDALFKSAFCEAEEAASLFRALLPSTLASRVDAESLTLVPGSFVDEALADRHADLLYSCQIDGRRTLIYLLLEHQSTVDPLMAYRIYRYVNRILDRWLSEHAGARRLPAVIPIVVYNGSARRTAPTELRALLDLPTAQRPELDPILPSACFILDDLSRAD